jgi:hypothetical protein
MRCWVNSNWQIPRIVVDEDAEIAETAIRVNIHFRMGRWDLPLGCASSAEAAKKEIEDNR